MPQIVIIQKNSYLDKVEAWIYSSLLMRVCLVSYLELACSVFFCFYKAKKKESD